MNDYANVLRVSAYLPQFFPSEWGQAGQYEFHLAQPSEAHDLKTELGLQDDAPAGIVTLKAPFGRKAYTYEVFLTYHNLLGTNDPQHALFVTGLEEPWQVPPVSIVIWWRRVYCHGSAAYLEARRDYRKGPTPISLQGVEKGTLHDAQRALAGLALFKRIERGGRPPDIQDEATCRQLCWDAYQNVLASGQRGTKTLVAAELLIHPRTLTRNLERYNIPWPPPPPH